MRGFWYARCADAAAQIADPFAAAIVANKDTISSARETLQEQLAFVEARIAEHGGADKAKLEEIQASQQKLDDEGITNNRHTTLTGKDVATQHEQYGVFLHRKKEMLEKAIEHERLRGLTQEQLNEINENFKLFDKDGSNSIDLKELKGRSFG